MPPESAENTPPQEKSFELDLSSLGFGPSWVSGPTENVSGNTRGAREGRGPRRERSEGGNFSRDQDRRGPRRDGPRPPDRDRGFRENRGFRSDWQEAPAPFQPVVSATFYPDNEKFELLGGAMKQSKMTYALFDIALLILDKEDRLSILLRSIEKTPGTKTPLAVSIPDGHPFLTEAEAVSHVLARHLDKFFDLTEVEIEAPKGSFLMVARCPQTGKILGAPTHHSYQRNLREHHAQHSPHVPFDRFKAKLEMVREPEAIESWLKSMSRRQEYIPKDRKEGEPERLETLDLARSFLITHRKDQVVKLHHEVRCRGSILKDLNAGPLLNSIRYALEAQRDFPLETANAIRGRLRKEGFFLYRKGSKGITYACSVRRRCRDPKATFSDSMTKIFAALDRQPGQFAKDLVNHLLGKNAPDEAKKPLIADLTFLISEGYIANLPSGNLFAQPVLSSQAEAKAEAANDEADGDEKPA